MATRNGADTPEAPALKTLALLASRPAPPAARRLAGTIPSARQATPPAPSRTSPATDEEAPVSDQARPGHVGFVPAGSTPTAPENGPNGHDGHQEPASGRDLSVGEDAEPGHLAGVTDLPDVDWDVVADLRTLVSERIKGTGEGGTITLASHGALAAPVIRDEVSNLTRRDQLIGGPGHTPAQQSRLCAAVRDKIFGMGRLQPTLELEGVSNVEVRWHRGKPITWVEFADGRLEQGPAATGSTAELIRDLQLLAGQSGRSFSPNSPLLNLTLENGSRLSATAWRTPAPVLTIRNHLFDDIDLWDMVAKNMLDEGMAKFLEALSLAGKNVVFYGIPGSAKTTLARAFLNALPPEVAIGVIESEFELRLEELLKHPHPRTVPMEARIGSGEMDSFGNRMGAVTMTELLIHMLRQNIQRIVVGEVRGPEIAAMLDAMLVSLGSVSTVHATSPMGAVQRLATCATKASLNTTTETAYRTIAQSIDVIVHLEYIDEGHLGGRRHRFISQIDALALGETEASFTAFLPIYEKGPDGRATPTGKVPSWIRDLENYGFDPGVLRRGNSNWVAPLELKRARR